MTIVKSLDKTATGNAAETLPRSAAENELVLSALDEYAKPYKELMSYYRCAIMEVETKFRVLNEEMSIARDSNPIETIKTRLKSPSSIISKLTRKGLPISVESIEQNLNDVAGVRVIVSHPCELYALAESFLSQDDIILIETKDYIKEPKENGYRSLHLIIEIPIYLKEAKKQMRVEVQLRTIAMDWWASLEHKIRYKKEIPDLEYLEQELKECADICAGLDFRMERLAEYALHISSSD